MGILRIEVDGGPATVDQLAHQAIVNYGHFTAMQVRHGAVRGLGLHLSRLDSATRELFGSGLDGELVRAHVRHALGADVRDGSVRISVFQPDADERPSIMVVVRPPSDPPAARARGRHRRRRDHQPRLLRRGRGGLAERATAGGHHHAAGRRALEERGVPSRHDQVHIADVRSLRSVFVTNSLGMAPVGQVDDQILATDAEFRQRLTEAYESVPWDPI